MNCRHSAIKLPVHTKAWRRRVHMLQLHAPFNLIKSREEGMRLRTPSRWWWRQGQGPTLLTGRRRVRLSFDRCRRLLSQTPALRRSMLGTLISRYTVQVNYDRQSIVRKLLSINTKSRMQLSFSSYSTAPGTPGEASRRVLVSLLCSHHSL